MSEVPLAGWRPVGLYILPKVVVGQLKDAREQRQETAIHRFGEIVAECFYLVHEWMQTSWNALDVLPLARVKVELFYPIWNRSMTLQVSEVGKRWLLLRSIP